MPPTRASMAGIESVAKSLNFTTVERVAIFKEP
jgi:hypothetical protein